MTTFAFVAGSGVGSATNRAIRFVILSGQSPALVLTLIAAPLACSLFDDASKLRLWRWRRTIRPAAATAAMLAVLLAATPASAQPVTTTLPQAGQESATGEIITMTRDEAVRLAIENNPDLAVVRFEPAASDARVSAAQAAFRPVFSSSLLRNSNATPPANLFSGEAGIQTDFWSGEAAVGQTLPWGGGGYDVSFASQRATTDNPFTSFTPSLTSALQAVFSQPLLRNFRIDPARAQVEIASRNREIADIQVRERQAQVSADAESAYWALVAALASVDVQQQSLDLALELERTNRARVDVGQSPPLDLVAAQAEVAQRRENLIVARTTALQAEDLLRTLVVDPRRSDYWGLRLDPAERQPAIAPPPDMDVAVRRALDQRSDIAQGRRQIENSETSVVLLRNQALPDLRARATYLTTGQGGSRLLRSGGFPGDIIGVQVTPFSSVLGQVFAADYPTWTVGLTLSYPIGRSVDDANLARAEIERDQAAARLRSLELTVVREVRDAALRLEQNRQRIETARLGRELAGQRLDAEQRRFEVGMSTSFLVIQAQRDLAVARDNEQRAYLDYQLASVAFERVQQVGREPMSGRPDPEMPSPPRAQSRQQ
jgi:outer membrane protein